MLLLPPDADEAVVGGVVERITKVIQGADGEIRNVDRWGRKRLAYPIRKQTEGYYVVVTFAADPAAITELERTLTLADEVLRHKVVVRAA
jgi:small subunit ribosomal protein S6